MAWLDMERMGFWSILTLISVSCLSSGEEPESAGGKAGSGGSASKAGSSSGVIRGGSGAGTSKGGSSFGDGGESTSECGGAGTTDGDCGGGGTGDGGGAGHSGGGASAGDGGSGGDGPAVGHPCSTAPGVQDADLTVRRPEIGMRVVGVAPNNPVRIVHDPTTGSILVATLGGDIFELDVDTGALTPAEASYPVPGGQIRGMAFGPDGTLYVMSSNGDISGTVHKGVPNGGGRTWTTLVSTTAYPPAGLANFSHNYSGIAVGADDHVYFSSGSRSDHGENGGEVPLTSAIFRVPVTSDNLVLPDNQPGLASYLFADGLRNPYSIAFNHAGELFAGDNGPDIDLPDEINWVRQGRHYGFPWRFGSEDNPVRDPSYTPAGDMRLHTGQQAIDNNTYVYDPAFPPPPPAMVDPIRNHGPDADKFRSGKTGPLTDASDAGTPFYGITAHRTPVGLMFDTDGALCGDYYRAGFFLSYGAVQDVMGDLGQDLMMMNMTKVGDAYEMQTSQLVAGFVSNPVDGVLIGNKIYVIEFSLGSIYEITLPAAE